MFLLVARTIPETAVVIIGSLGRISSTIAHKLGQIVGKVVIIEATVAFGKSGQSRSLNPRIMAVVLGEMNKGMSGINDLSTSHKRRVFRFGSKGLLMMESRMTERTFQDGESRVAHPESSRIL